MFVIKYRKIFYAISTILILGSIFSIFYFGLNLGIDFKGGTIIEAGFSKPVDIVSIKDTVGRLPFNDANGKVIGLGDFSVRMTGEKGVILRTRELGDSERIALTSTLKTIDGGAEIKRFDTVGPVLGDELKGKALWSIGMVLLAIVLFITFAFRHVSRPVASWKYGVVAIIALLHDVLVPTGVFAILGYLKGFEIDALFVTAILVILGFSVHDTIVVFDRTRENLKHNPSGKNEESFEHIVGKSVSQTFTRSINTSLTVVLSLIILYALGPETTRSFSLVMLVGIIVGTYSSIFIGSPLLVTLQKYQEKK